MPSPFKTMAQFKAHNAATNRHFFDRDTTKFFRSRIESSLYGGRYFITSEQYTGIDGVECPRRFAVRRANDDGSVTTIGDMRQYRDVETAQYAARQLAKQEKGGIG